MKVGQPCVVRYREIFWRAVISEVPSSVGGDDDILCLLVDHAEPIHVPKKDIFVIDKTFMALPLQVSDNSIHLPNLIYREVEISSVVFNFETEVISKPKIFDVITTTFRHPNLRCSNCELRRHFALPVYANVIPSKIFWDYLNFFAIAEKS